MRKAKMTITVEVEYDIDPEHYPGVTDPMQMLKVDINGAEEDPYMWLDRTNATWTIKGELINGPGTPSY